MGFPIWIGIEKVLMNKEMIETIIVSLINEYRSLQSESKFKFELTNAL